MPRSWSQIPHLLLDLSEVALMLLFNGPINLYPQNIRESKSMIQLLTGQLPKSYTHNVYYAEILAQYFNKEIQVLKLLKLAKY